jgi:DNA repair exonuclease SbcCD ATPase subunit
MPNLRLKRLHVSEFRCFGEADLDLSSDVVAIYGRNGVGKTSVFDAIEFALFGCIDRLGDFSEDTDYVSRVGGETAPRVRLDFQSGPRPVTWVETTWNREEGCVESIGGNRKWSTHRNLLYGLLVDRNSLGKRKDVAAVGELFRATLMLSQDSIRRFIEEGPEERAKVFARLAGLAHIQRSRDKAQEVVRLAERELRKVSSQLQQSTVGLRELELRFAEKQGRCQAILERLGGERPALTDLARALGVAGIDAPHDSLFGEDTLAIARAARGRCDERRRELESRSSRLASLEAGLVSHTDRQARLARIQQQGDELRVQLYDLVASHAHLVGIPQAAVDRIAPLNVRAQEISAEIQRTQELRELSRDLTASRDAVAQILVESLERDETAARHGLADKNRARATTSIRKAEAAKAVAAAQRHLARLNALRDQLPRYASAAGELETARSNRDRSQDQLRRLNEVIQEESSRLESIEARIAEAQDELSRREAMTEEHSTLVSRLREFATGDACPLCGTAHPSNPVLLEAIDVMLREIPESVRSASALLQAARNERAEHQALLSRNRQEHSVLTESLTAVRTRIQELESEGADMESQASALGILPSEEKLRDAIESWTLQLLTHQEALRDQAATLSELDQVVEDLERSASRALGELDDARNRRRQLEGRLEELLVRLSELGCREKDFPSQNELVAVGNHLRDELAQVEQARNALEVERQRAEDKEKASIRQRRSLEKKLTSLDRESGDLSGEIERFRSRSREFGFKGDATNESLAEVRRSIDSQADAVREARGVAEKFELASELETLQLDTNNIRTECSSAKEQVKEIRKERGRLQNARATAEAWIPPLSSSLTTAVEKTIVSHQLEIERHFKAMIPSPHLFDAITMRQVEERLELGVRYRNQGSTSGEPRAFLSNGQLNLLALSIFLSLGAKQRWSRLDSLLLDDPIQHLDDLDAIAFLDTLRAVALGRFGKRKQVILSTCDRNLYRLMIQKFKLLEPAGARFTAISLIERGSGGPLIHYDAGDTEQANETQSA